MITLLLAIAMSAADPADLALQARIDACKAKGFKVCTHCEAILGRWHRPCSHCNSLGVIGLQEASTPTKQEQLDIAFYPPKKRLQIRFLGRVAVGWQFIHCHFKFDSPPADCDCAGLILSVPYLRRLYRPVASYEVHRWGLPASTAPSWLSWWASASGSDVMQIHSLLSCRRTLTPVEFTRFDAPTLRRIRILPFLRAAFAPLALASAE